MKHIAERIKEIRKSEGLTQAKFAERLGIKQNTVATYEMGRSTPLGPIITSICREFGVSEEWLRYGTGEMRVESTEKETLIQYFADVLTTAPDARSRFVAVLAELPPEFYPLVEEMAKKYVAKVTELVADEKAQVG